MADFDWAKPTVGGSSGTWGTELNTILDVIQAHPGIKVVADADAKAAYVPLLGQVILQADTGVLYKCTNATGPVWAEIGPAATADSTLTTKGDLLVYGSALSRLGVGTNGQVLTADSAQALGVKWAAASGGGGVPERWYLPKDADEGYDDEFHDGSIDAAWNTVDVPSYANTWFEVAGIKGLSVLTAAGKGSFKITGLLRSMGTMTAPCFIETAVRGDSQLFNFPGLGLIFADGITYGAGTQVIFMGPFSGGYRSLFRYTKYNSRESFADLQSQVAAIRDRLYMRFYWSAANTFSTYISPNGIVWAPMHSAVSLTCSPTYFGLCVSGLDNDTYPIMGDFAYFRARAGAPANG